MPMKSRSGSYPTFDRNTALIVNEAVTTSAVWPSGVACAVSVVAMVPLAPERFSPTAVRDFAAAGLMLAINLGEPVLRHTVAKSDGGCALAACIAFFPLAEFDIHFTLAIRDAGHEHILRRAGDCVGNRQSKGSERGEGHA
jgi:hypothetical protein